jgi:hypothetical protein
LARIAADEFVDVVLGQMARCIPKSLEMDSDLVGADVKYVALVQEDAHMTANGYFPIVDARFSTPVNHAEAAVHDEDFAVNRIDVIVAIEQYPIGPAAANGAAGAVEMMARCAPML